jgi:pimeloyl-ACP methyl ester carboxylesterase
MSTDLPGRGCRSDRSSTGTLSDVPTRRAVLLGGAGAVAGLVGAGVAVERDVLPGRTFAYEHLGLNGADGVVPDIEPGRVLTGTFASEARGIDVDYRLILPPGDEDLLLPVVVALHWLGADAATLTSDRLGLDRYLAQHVADGGRPFVIAAADGGRGYWHPHAGDDAGAMVIDELLPLLAGQGRSTDRVGFLGWSMGGYGALRLAGLRGADATSAVVACSPAIWTDSDEASPKGFTDAEEYREFSVFDRQDDLEGIPVRLDVGRGDPFYLEVQEYAEGLSPDSEVGYEAGGHTPGYWRRMLPVQLGWLGRRV